MSTIVPMYGFGGGGGTGATLTVTAPSGCTVTVTKDGKTKTKTAGADGVAVFKGLKSGQWTVTITDGSHTAQKVAVINTDYALVISFNTLPEFTYTGDYEIVNDADEPITASQDNWKIRFLTSGTLTFTNLNVAENGIDVFCVGGGGASRWGGGGGGYTTTKKRMPVSIGTPYDIVIGAGGGSEGANGGETSAFGVSAKGGYGGKTSASNGDGGDGGCGGGGWGSPNGGSGGTDGSDGVLVSGTTMRSAGKGQGTTTREFGELNAKTYAGGGSGGYGDRISSGVGGSYVGGSGKGDSSSKNGQTNTGGGGGGRSGNTTFGCGGSGIVVIRNAREVS